MRPGPEEFKTMVSQNRWHDREQIDAFVSAIKQLSEDPKWTPVGDYAEGSNRWSWAKNWRCKYVSLRFDMRDGGFVMTDSKGERISLDDLKYQWSPDEDQPPSPDLRREG